MSRERTPEEIKRFLAEYRDNFEKRSLMYGGDLNGVEAAWHTLQEIEAFLAGEDVGSSDAIKDDLRFRSYSRVARRYKCGSWVISAKVREEMGEGVEAAAELIKRLKEVDAVRAQLRAERGIGQ